MLNLLRSNELNIRGGDARVLSENIKPKIGVVIQWQPDLYLAISVTN